MHIIVAKRPLPSAPGQRAAFRLDMGALLVGRTPAACMMTCATPCGVRLYICVLRAASHVQMRMRLCCLHYHGLLRQNWQILHKQQ